MKKPIPRIFITPGEPAGIGPDIVVKIAQEKWPAELIVVGDPDLLKERATLLHLPLTLEIQDPPKIDVDLHHPGTLHIIPVKLNAPCQPGHLNPLNANYVLRCLELATDYCLKEKTSALVTGPVHKGIINDAGFPFTGHTEFLATRCNTPRVLMLFVTNKMKVALATIHIPLSQVPQAITTDHLLLTIRLLNAEIKKHFGIPHPQLMICGLNPHAGESGHLGREEIDIIIPALQQLREEKINVIGPLPADTIFTDKYLNTADSILAMYHDQALPVVKYQGFDHAVNMTLGLPIIRTSVDHGTALDIAGTHQANAGSLTHAIQLAIQLISMKK